MSTFLGPIHFWLYRKIGKQEELTKAIASYAEQKGWIEEQVKYTKDLPALEDVIDESNIHGWLQGQLHDAETRYVELIGDVWNTARSGIRGFLCQRHALRQSKLSRFGVGGCAFLDDDAGHPCTVLLTLE